MQTQTGSFVRAASLEDVRENGRLAAHAPTSRSQGQTYTIARRLSRGESLHEEVG